MELFLFGVLIAIITVGLSVGGLFIARKYISPATREANNSVADPMLQVIGTLYAVLLGLLVVQSMETFEGARHNVEKEAVALADTFRLAQALPKDLRIRLQNSCLDYAASVVDREWDDMQELDTCDAAWEAIDKMWWDVISFEPKTVREQYVYPEVLAAAKELNDHRRSRLLTSRSMVSPVLWCVLIVGAFSTIVFTYTFGTNSLKSQLYMTSLVAVTLSLNLYLWSIYSNPFYGLLRVEPEAFKMDLEHFQFYLDNPDELRWNKYTRKEKTPKKKKSKLLEKIEKEFNLEDSDDDTQDEEPKKGTQDGSEEGTSGEGEIGPEEQNPGEKRIFRRMEGNKAVDEIITGRKESKDAAGDKNTGKRVEGRKGAGENMDSRKTAGEKSRKSDHKRAAGEKNKGRRSTKKAADKARKNADLEP